MIKSRLKYLRISPRKVRLVADLIRGMDAVKAERQLTFLNRRAKNPLLNLLKSALANAKSSADLEKENLYISEVRVDKGPTLKRWRPRAFGRATPILKRTSHIFLALEEKKSTGKSKKGSKQFKKEQLVQQQEKKTPIIAKDKKTKSYRKLFKTKKGFFKDKGVDKSKKLFRRKSI